MKIKSLFYVAIFLATISLSGCKWIDDYLRTPQQKWITIEDESSLWLGENLHIRIYDGLIWENGNEALEVRVHIEKNLKLQLTIP